jgi:hypothetical protein
MFPVLVVAGVDDSDDVALALEEVDEVFWVPLRERRVSPIGALRTARDDHRRFPWFVS